MSTIYRCDRCGAEEDLHTRSIQTAIVGLDLSTFSDAPQIDGHLCGYCYSRLRVFMAGEQVDALRTHA